MLLALKIEGKRRTARAIDDQHHGAVGLQAVALGFDAIVPGGCDLEGIAVPLGFALEVGALTDGRVFARIGVESIRSRRVLAFRIEIARDVDIVLPVVDCNFGRLNHSSTRQVAAIGNQ